jgi:hypothetical protein
LRLHKRQWWISIWRRAPPGERIANNSRKIAQRSSRKELVIDARDGSAVAASQAGNSLDADFVWRALIGMLVQLLQQALRATQVTGHVTTDLNGHPGRLVQPEVREIADDFLNASERGSGAIRK